MASGTWRPPAPVRDITIHKGEGVRIGGKLRKAIRDETTGRVVGRELWTPPDGSTVYYTVYRSDDTPLTIPCTLDGPSFDAVISAAQADTISSGDEFWFYVQVPGSDPKCITTGSVCRKDPHPLEDY